MYSYKYQFYSIDRKIAVLRKNVFHATLIKLNILDTTTFQAPIERIQSIKEKKVICLLQSAKLAFYGLRVPSFPSRLR